MFFQNKQTVFGVTSTATTGASTTLVATSTTIQVFTGTLAQTIILPVATTMVVGQNFSIINQSTQILTVQYQDASSFTLQANIATGNSLNIILTSVGSSNGTWVVDNSSAPPGVTSTATAAGTTTLVENSTQIQVFTGSLSQTIKLPVATTMINGQPYEIYNQSSAPLTVQYQDASSFTQQTTVAPNTSLVVKLVSNSTANGLWSVQASSSGGINPWAASYPYAVGNLVIYSNQIYICQTINTSGASFEADAALGYWARVDESSNNRNLMLDGTNMEDGDSGAWQPFTVGSYSAGTTPTGSFTAGTGASISLSAQSSGALSGKYSLQLTTATTFTAGQGFCTKTLTIDPASQSKMQSVSFDYSATAGSSNIDFSGTSSNTFHVYFYDATNSVYIQLINVYGMAATKGKYFGQFQMPYNCTSGYLLVLVANANTSGTTTLLFDNFFVGQAAFAGYGMVGSDPSLYIPTITGCGTVSAVNVNWSREGKYLNVYGVFTSGTVSATTFNFSLPAGLTVDSSYDATSQMVLGSMTRNASSTSPVAVLTISGANFVGASNYVGAVNTMAFQPGNQLMGSSEKQSIAFRVPIQGWSSQSQIVSQYDGRVVAASVTTTSNYSAGGGANIAFPVVTFDTTGSYNTSTGGFTCPVSGIYTVSVASFNPSASSAFFVNKNGTQIGALMNGNGAVYSGSANFKCVAGDVLSVVAGTSVTLYYNGVGYSPVINISLLSGAQQILAGQTIAASYYCSTNQSASTSTPINFDSKEFDTTNSVTTGSGWKFTAPTSGLYNIEMFSQSGTGSYYFVYKNGSSYKLLSYNSAATGINTLINLIQLNAGDYIDIRPATSSTIGGGALTSTTTSWIAIKQI